MDEGTVAADDNGESLDLSFRKMPKPPDKKKYNAEMEPLVKSIKDKETELRNLLSSKQDSTSENLRSIKEQKQKNIALKAQVEETLRKLNKENTNRSIELTKIQGNLQGFRNEAKLTEAIQKLEHQLKTTNFKVRDEKQIVIRLDSLNRARRWMVLYNQTKKELDGMRDQQRRLREQRDIYYKEVHKLKCKEDELRQKVQLDRSKSDSLRKEISDLYDQKGVMIQKFKVEEKEYHDQQIIFRKKKEEDMKRKKAEARHERELAYQKDLAEYHASREPFEDEKMLCATLIAYLKPFCPADNTENISPASSTSGESVDSLAQSFEKDGLVLLKKKEEDLFSGLAKSRNSKRGKKEKKKILQNKPLLHMPQTLSQFASLEIKAPASSQEVPEAIEQLESKKSYYESLLGSKLPHHHSSPPSVGESAFTESIPSTPDVSLDNTPPRFPSTTLQSGEGATGGDKDTVSHDTLGCDFVETRRLSHDSGACELDIGEGSLETTVGENSVYGATGDCSQALESLAQDVAWVMEKDIDSCDRDTGDDNTDSSTSSVGTVVENLNQQVVIGNSGRVENSLFTAANSSVNNMPVPTDELDLNVIASTDANDTNCGASGDFKDHFQQEVSAGEKSVIEQLSHTMQQAVLNEKIAAPGPSFSTMLGNDTCSDHNASAELQTPSRLSQSLTSVTQDTEELKSHSAHNNMTDS